MGRTPCCSKVGLMRGLWSSKEDALLTNYVQIHGEGHWRSLPKKAGLLRCGKSCRLRWRNYLRPGIKRGNISKDEEDLIVRLHALLGNRWSLIAGRLPSRTDNEIKNYWNTYILKKLNKDSVKSKKPTGKQAEDKNKIIMAEKGEEKNNDDSIKIIVYKPKPIRVSSPLFIKQSIGNLTPSFRAEEENIQAPLPWSALLELEDIPYVDGEDIFPSIQLHESFAGDINILDYAYDKFHQLV